MTRDDGDAGPVREAPTKPMPRRKPSTAVEASAEVVSLAYTNRRGVTYYLHAGFTKTGKPCYFFARSQREERLRPCPSATRSTNRSTAP